MILYKYVSLEAANRILEKSSVGFSKAKYFNDPFDIPQYPPIPGANPVEELFSGIAVWAKNHAWVEKTGILALTRTPTNPLMWAHYADQHRGAVIGIDAAAAGLTDEKSNLIPAQYGSMIYMSRRSNEPFITEAVEGLSVGNTFEFRADHYEKLQRLFLHKPLYWSYEEEVRVAKCLAGVLDAGGETQSGHFEIVKANGRDLHLFSIPPASIRELHFGLRVDATTKVAAREKYPQLDLYECIPDNTAYSISHKKFVTTEEQLAGWHSLDTEHESK